MYGSIAVIAMACGRLRRTTWTVFMCNF